MSKRKLPPSQRNRTPGGRGKENYECYAWCVRDWTTQAGFTPEELERLEAAIAKDPDQRQFPSLFHQIMTEIKDPHPYDKVRAEVPLLMERYEFEIDRFIKQVMRNGFNLPLPEQLARWELHRKKP